MREAEVTDWFIGRRESFLSFFFFFSFSSPPHKSSSLWKKMDVVFFPVRGWKRIAGLISRGEVVRSLVEKIEEATRRGS